MYKVDTMVQLSRIHALSKAFHRNARAEARSNALGQSDAQDRTKARRFPLVVGILWIMILPIAVACLVGCGGFTAPKSSPTSSTRTLQITNNVLPVGTVQNSYNAPLAVTGGLPPYSWTQTGGQLPTGLTLVSATGAIVGAPTSSGTFSFTTKVVDSRNESLSAEFFLDIATGRSGDSPLRITTNALPVGAAQSSYATTIVATGGVPPYSWTQTSGRLPAGLQLSSTTGTIAGMPISAGNFSFTTMVQDSKAHSASTDFSLNVSTAPAPSVSAVSPSSGSTEGGTLVTIGGSNFGSGTTVAFGSLPAQSVRVLNANEIQAVTPAASNGKVIVTVQESDGQVAAAPSAFTFTAPATPISSDATAVSADVVVDASQTVSETGGDDLAAAKNIFASASNPESNGGLSDWNLISSELTMTRMRIINGLGDCAMVSGKLTGCSRLNDNLSHVLAENLTPHVIVGQWAPSSIPGDPRQWGASQWAQYDALSYAIVNWVVNQYGGTGFNGALFEVANEIDITTSAQDLWLTPSPNVPQGDPSRFAQYDTVYRHWAAAVSKVAQQNPNKNIRIAAQAEGYQWVQYTQQWNNKMIPTYDSQHVKFDAISLHAYGANVTGMAQFAQSIRTALNANGNSNVEILMTEWGANWAGDRNFGAINATNQGAAWAVHFLTQCLQGTITGGSFLGIRDNSGTDVVGVNSNIYLASWLHVENSIEYPKAITNAFNMVSRMTGSRRPASVNTAKPNLNALASSDGTSASLVVANYNTVFGAKSNADLTSNESVTVAFKNLPFSGAVTVDRYVIDANTSNLDSWVAAGKVPPSVQSTQLQKVESFSATANDGTLSIPARELGQSAVSLWIVHP
jgi:hypothetical protein